MIPENYALERVDVSALSAFAGNPRTHSDGQIDQIAASIREFGWTNPILVDAEGTIIAGHGRLEAAKRLQLREVPVIRLGHLSEAQRKALVIADNQLALNAGWDEVALSNLIRDLDASDFELDVLGFVAEDLERYLAGIDVDTGAESDEGELPEVPVEPVSKPGDLWILGIHRLLCGDATVLSDLERLAAGTVPRARRRTPARRPRTRPRGRHRPPPPGTPDSDGSRTCDTPRASRGRWRGGSRASRRCARTGERRRGTRGTACWRQTAVMRTAPEVAARCWP